MPAVKGGRRVAAPIDPGLEHGFRSGLEEKISAELEAQGVPVIYETDILEYIKPQRTSKYHPDFKIFRKDGTFFYVETKGRFVTADRQKHVLLRDQRQEEIRFVFSNSRAKISKTSKTTYAMWCEKHGFKFADKSIPASWLSE